MAEKAEGKHLFKYYVYLFYRERYRKIESERVSLLSAGLLLKCLQQLDLDQTKVKSLTPQPESPTWWQGLKYLNHHLLPPHTCIIRKLKSEVEPGIKTMCSDMGCGHPRKYITHCANV